MEVRQAIHSEHAKTLDTAGLRRHFLVEQVFEADALKLTYSHIDRIIVGGAFPATRAVEVPNALGKTIGVEHLLERRELGAINIGGPTAGWRWTASATRWRIEEAIYIGQGAQSVAFGSDDAARPAKFYLNCAPAHTRYPTRVITLQQASPETLGDNPTSNRRTIYKFIVPDVLQTCQLSMGMTKLEPGNLWNTMPCHTHERRMEVYFYFNMQENAGGVPHDGRAAGNAPYRGAQRAGGDLAELVDPLGRWHAGLHLHLGHGRREPGLRGHGPRRDRRSALKHGRPARAGRRLIHHWQSRGTPCQPISST